MFEQMIAVIIGGIIGIGGVFVGQVVSHFYTREREREKLIRDKGENVLKALYRHREWLDVRRVRFLFEDRDHYYDSNPMDEVLTLQRLYFPSCREALSNVLKEVMPLVAFYYEQRLVKSKDKDA